MEKVIIKMKWKVSNKSTVEQRHELMRKIDKLMNETADLFDWEEEEFSIETKEVKNEI